MAKSSNLLLSMRETNYLCNFCSLAIFFRKSRDKRLQLPNSNCWRFFNSDMAFTWSSDRQSVLSIDCYFKIMKTKKLIHHEDFINFLHTRTFIEVENFHPKILRPRPKFVIFRVPVVELIRSFSRWFKFPKMLKSRAFSGSFDAEQAVSRDTIPKIQWQEWSRK